MQFRDEIAGGVVLVRPALQSPDYVAGASGWRVAVDGSAEFNRVTIRGGTVIGGESLYYDPAPGAGNLIMSIAATAGTDPYGNTFERGLAWYTSTGAPAVQLGDDIPALLNGEQGVVAYDVPGARWAGLTNGSVAFAPTTRPYASSAALGLVYISSTDPDAMRVLVRSGRTASYPAQQHALVYIDSSATGAPAEVTMVAESGATDDFLLDVHGNVEITGQITRYASATTFTPTIVNAGSATWSTRTGRYVRLGPLYHVRVDLVASAAGSGATLPGVTMPFAVDRSTRQILALHAETVTVSGGTGAATIRNGQAVFFSSAEGGTGSTSDRWRVDDSDGDGANNLQGVDIRPGSKITLEGWLWSA